MNRLQTGTVLAIAIGIGPALAQAAPGPSYRLDPAQRRVLEFSNLYTDPSCQPGRLSGRVVRRQFDELGTMVTGVTIEEADGSRTFANIHVDTANAARVDAGWIVQGLQLLLKEGNRVALGVKYCGAAGRVIVIDSIRPTR